jgi:hypothetical protein
MGNQEEQFQRRQAAQKRQELFLITGTAMSKCILTTVMMLFDTHEVISSINNRLCRCVAVDQIIMSLSSSIAV